MPKAERMRYLAGVSALLGHAVFVPADALERYAATPTPIANATERDLRRLAEAEAKRARRAQKRVGRR